MDSDTLISNQDRIFTVLSRLDEMVKAIRDTQLSAIYQEELAELTRQILFDAYEQRH